ncbi:MAG: hypothetical protein V4504_01710 [Patescibacteria group bacterium]
MKKIILFFVLGIYSITTSAQLINAYNPTDTVKLNEMMLSNYNSNLYGEQKIKLPRKGKRGFKKIEKLNIEKDSTVFETFLSPDEINQAESEKRNQGYTAIKFETTAKATIYELHELPDFYYVEVKASTNAKAYNIAFSKNKEDVYQKDSWRKGFVRKVDIGNCKTFPGLYNNLLGLKVKTELFNTWLITNQ